MTVVPGGTVKLQEDKQTLEEVVVVGYGSQKKAHLTGSVATVPVDEIQDLANGGLASSLNGLVNGLSVSGGDSRPGENAKINIRDANSLTEIGSSNNGPLYVIDGYIYPNDVKVGNTSQNLGEEAFNNLDASVIENISVLKDASAAVYGARAANGVILVTTKKGKQGAPSISYSGQFGWTGAVSHAKMLSAYDWARLYNATTAADPISNTSLNRTTSLYQLDELEAMKSLNYDLLEDNWKTGFTQRHAINISGASERASYFGGVSYFKQDGNLGKLDYNRYNYRAGTDVKINDWLKANITVSGDHGEKNKPNIKIGGSNQENDYNYLLMRPRYIPEYVNEDGVDYPIASYGITNSKVKDYQLYHYTMMQNNGDYSNSVNSNITVNGGVTLDLGFWKPLKGLTASLSYSKSISTTKNNEYGSSFTLYSFKDRSGSGSHLYTPVNGVSPTGHTSTTISNGDPSYLSRNTTRTDNYQLNFTLNYARDFGKHHVGGVFSIERSEAESEYLMGKVSDPYTFTTGQSNSAEANTKDVVFTHQESGSLSYIGRVNYNYESRYLLEFMLRADASTKFAPENMWGYFPSISAGWVASEEPWFSDVKWLKWIDYLKIRASWGLTGRDNTAAWQWMRIYAQDADSGPVFGDNNESLNRITYNKFNSAVNRDVHWDKSYKANIGLDLNVLNSRLGITFEAYKVWNREMLMNMSQNIQAVIGTQSAAVNLGEMNSWGYELSLNWKDKIGKDFKYKVGLNTGYSDNSVLNMDWVTNYLYRQITYGGRTDIGMWGMQCIGMFRSFQDIQEYVQANNITSYMGMSPENIRPGMLIYKDVRGTNGVGGPDGIVDQNDDQVCLSNRSNPYGFSLNLSAEWKGISLTTQFQASWGGYSMIDGAALKTGDGLAITNMPSFWNPDNMYVYEDIYDGSGNLIMKANRDAEYPNLKYASVNAAQSNFWRVSGTTIKWSRLTLAYSIPSKWLKATGIGIKSVRLNITGQNLLSLYNPYPDKYIDPMSSYGRYPALRKFTLGVNVSF
jgi:TonB-linked SusC/RagA family outer membrane protein